MVPSRPLTRQEEREVHYLYHMVIELAVKLEIQPNDAQREHLTQLLLQAIDDESEQVESLLIRAAINYIRAVQ